MSVSIKVKPVDHRCKFWAKIIRAGVELPLPQNVASANDIPGRYLKLGDEEMEEGDIIMEGESNHHTKNRGMSYNIGAVIDGKLRYFPHDSGAKAAMKAHGMPVELLKGAGDVAAMVRTAHGIRSGWLKLARGNE